MSQLKLKNVNKRSAFHKYNASRLLNTTMNDYCPQESIEGLKRVKRSEP